jgi:hypothetical protein
MSRLAYALPFVFLLSETVQAGPVTLYDNGPVTGVNFAWAITDGYQVSNSFTLTSGAKLTGIQFGTQEINNSTPVVNMTGIMTSVNWTISTGPAGSVGPGYTNGPSGTILASGTASVTDKVVGIAPSYDGPTTSLNEVNFSLSNVTLGPGMYYLTLTDPIAGDSGAIGWDQSNGLSKAYQTGAGYLNGNDIGMLVNDPSFTGLIGGSESFQVFGTPIPEPSTVAAFAVMLLLGATVSLRRRRTWVGA